MPGLCVVAALILTVAGTDDAVRPEEREAAVKSAESWVEAFQSGDPDAVWAQSAIAFKARHPRQGWRSFMELLEEKSGLGRPMAHKQTGRSVHEVPPDVDENDQYVSIEFELEYQEGRASLVLTPVLEPDGVWRVLGFTWKALDDE